MNKKIKNELFKKAHMLLVSNYYTIKNHIQDLKNAIKFGNFGKVVNFLNIKIKSLEQANKEILDYLQKTTLKSLEE